MHDHALSAALLLLLGCSGPGPGNAPDPVPEDPGAALPHIVVVVVDSMRADRLFAERNGQRIAPTMARLAEQGVWFERSYAQSGWTMPGLAAILTGRYPPPLTMREGQSLSWLPEDTNTLPRILGMYGYQCAALWGASLPSEFEQLSRDFHQVSTLPEDTPWQQAYGRELEAWLEGASGQVPWFLLLHQMDLHHAVPAPPFEVADRWVPGPPNSPEADLERRYAAMLQSHGQEVARRETIGAYDGLLSFYDAELATMLAALEAAAGERELVVVITSNHGQDLWDHGFMGHGGRHFDSILRVPLVWWDLDGEGQSGGDDTRVQAIDLAPSLLERAGAEPDRGMDGRSLLPLLGLADGSYEPRPVYAYSNPMGTSLVDGDYKLAIFSGRADDERHPRLRSPEERLPAPHLFHLADDPSEHIDLAESEPDLTASMSARLVEWTQGRRATIGPSVATDEAFRQALQERGYWEHVAPSPEEGSPR